MKRYITIISILAMLFNATCAQGYGRFVLRPLAADENKLRSGMAVSDPFYAGKEELAERTKQMREHFKMVERIIRETPELWRAIESEQHMNMLLLCKGVADSVIKPAGGKDFYIAVYPCSGPDITSIAPFSEHFVTIDMNHFLKQYYLKDIGEDITRAKIARNIKHKLEGRIYSGAQISSWTNYAVELILMGADLDTFNVTSEIVMKDATSSSAMTTAEFEANNFAYSGKFVHTHFSFIVRKKFHLEDPYDNFLKRKLNDLMDGKNTVILSKAGKAGVIDPDLSTDALYSIAPFGTVFVCDSGEKQHAKLSGSGRPAVLEDLKTRDIRDELFSLNILYPGIQYGYTGDLITTDNPDGTVEMKPTPGLERDLAIFRLVNVVSGSEAGNRLILKRSAPEIERGI